MSDNKKIAIAAAIAVILIVALALLIPRTLDRSSDPQGAAVGVFKPDIADPTPEPITSGDREEEYQSREELPQSMEETILTTIERQLSAGKFSSLDATLREWQERYKDDDDESFSSQDTIDSYRADLAYCMALSDTDDPPQQAWAFRNADVLASAVAFAPISMKYQAFLSKDSIIFPQATEDISLTPSSKTSEEYAQTRDEINKGRTAENAYRSISIYDMVINGYKCEFIAVLDIDSWLWQPYQLRCGDAGDLLTVGIVSEIAETYTGTDLDAVFAMPAQISVAFSGDAGSGAARPSPELSPEPAPSTSVSDAGQTADPAAAGTEVPEEAVSG